MGATSNQAKQHWNKSRYAQLKISVQPGLAAAFKAKCMGQGVSMASEISRFMQGETGGDRCKKPPANPFATRQQRRKALARLIEQLGAIADAEQSYLGNIPENLQSSCLHDAAEQTVSALDEALNILAEAY
jgi:hypothetical protein